jgi:hypothetical protein
VAVVGAFGASAVAVTPSSVSVVVDGRDELRFSSGGVLTAHHFSWSHPSDLVVDGVGRPLSWVGNVSAPVGVSVSGEYWVRKVAGRDSGYAVQRGDGFMLAISDNPNGADVYGFEFAAVPGGKTFDWMHVTANPVGPAGEFSFAGVPGYGGVAAGTEITVSLDVDGTEELLFTGQGMVIRHLAWELPAGLVVDGAARGLMWAGNVSQALPLAMGERVRFEQIGGRSTLYAVETAAGLLVSANDELVGADRYTFRLTVVPEPGRVLGGLVMLGFGLRRRG